jgi:hypothetical protein
MSFITRVSLAVGIFLVDLLLFFVPVAAILTVYILLVRPAWFARLVEKIYSEVPDGL